MVNDIERCPEYIVRFGSSKACYQQSNSFCIKIIQKTIYVHIHNMGFTGGDSDKEPTC